VRSGFRAAACLFFCIAGKANGPVTLVHVASEKGCLVEANGQGVPKIQIPIRARKPMPATRDQRTPFVGKMVPSAPAG